MLRNKFLLIAIVILATALRFWQLGQNPPSLDWDEAAHGYNAYSILKTGRDEYGYKFPLYFRSFDDYKPPIYTYLVVPSIAIFGLNDFAVRFPSAFLGVFAVLFTYLLVKELFKNETIALLSALFLAISPWHLHFSRIAFEANLTIFWLVLGTWAFLRGIKSGGLKITFWMSLAALAYGANLFTYHSTRVFIPIFSLCLLILFKNKLINIKKYLIVPALISIAFVIILIPIITSISGQMRFMGTTIFEDVSPQYKTSELIAQDEKSGQLTIGKIIHNRRFVYIKIFFDNYLSHLKPTYLFLTADTERYHTPQVGLLFLWDLPFILVGIYCLFRKNFEIRSKIIIFLWFLIAPIASSITRGTPHSFRSLIYLPTYQIFIAIGVVYFYSWLKSIKIITRFVFFLPTIVLATAGLLIFNFLFYLHQYYFHMPNEYSKDWFYGRKEAAFFTEGIKDKYDRVIVSTELEQPHEFWLYYLKYDPVKYLHEGGTISGGFFEDQNKFDKYFFKPIDFDKQQKEARTLFVGIPKELDTTPNVIKIIKYLNGEPAIYIAESQ